MTVVRRDGRMVESSDSPACGPVRAEWISEVGGLTQFGAVVEVLPPGSRSSVKHWHMREDELVYVLEGEVDLWEGATCLRLRPGDAAVFRAGDAVGHCLENRGGTPVRYLVVGTRAGSDVVTYPDHDRVLHRDGDNERWTDGAGRPADTPYSG